MSHPSIDAATLLASWRAAGELPPAAESGVAAAILADAAEDRPPLYLKILAALGTLLATAFFLAFLGVAGLISFDNAASLLTWGLLFLGVGMGLAVVGPRVGAGLGHDLLAQSALTTLALGKVLTVIGLIERAGVDTPWVPAVALLGVTVLTYPLSGSSLDRVLSPYAVAVAVLVEIVGRGSFHGDATAGLSVFFLLATVTAGALLLSHRVPLAVRPIGTAALATMGTIVALLASGEDAGLWAAKRSLDPRWIEALLTLALVGVLAWVAGGFDRLARPPLALAVVGVVLLGFAGAPGISFALLVLVVGHALHDMPLRVVGALALPAFLVLWYYGRDLTFLEKSAALVASGGLLLLGRALIARAGWDREEVS